MDAFEKHIAKCIQNRDNYKPYKPVYKKDIIQIDPKDIPLPKFRKFEQRYLVDENGNEIKLPDLFEREQEK